MKRMRVLVAVILLLSVPAVSKARLEGWIYMSWPYAYSAVEGGDPFIFSGWHYIDESAPQWCVDLTSNLWGTLGQDTAYLSSGWAYYSWPFVYSPGTGRWYYLYEGSVVYAASLPSVSYPGEPPVWAPLDCFDDDQFATHVRAVIYSQGTQSAANYVSQVLSVGSLMYRGSGWTGGPGTVTDIDAADAQGWLIGDGSSTAPDPGGAGPRFRQTSTSAGTTYEWYDAFGALLLKILVAMNFN